MGERYDEYFRARLERFASERVASAVPFAEEANRIVAEGSLRAELPYREQVRPEALYLLTVCLHEMVLGPAAAVEDEKLGELRQRLTDDVETILNHAVREVEARGDSDITGHAILNAVEATWPNLASTTFLDWEQ